jgi:hypothetical protein
MRALATLGGLPPDALASAAIVCLVRAAPQLTRPVLQANASEVRIACEDARGSCALRHWFAVATVAFPRAQYYGALHVSHDEPMPPLPLEWRAWCPTGKTNVGRSELRAEHRAWYVDAREANAMKTQHRAPALAESPTRVWHAYANLCAFDESRV